jgi:chemotaxis protein MotB
MRMRGKTNKTGKSDILIRKEEVVEGEAHGGSWKVAYADFVTAMMAFFLLMWLLNATTEEQRKGLADYFSPNSVLSHNSSGTGQPFGGRTAFSDGAMLSDQGNPQVTVGKQPVVGPVEEDDTEIIAQPRPHRDDPTSKEPDLSGRPPAKPLPRQARNAAPSGLLPVAGNHGGARRCAAQAHRGGTPGGGGKTRKAGLRAGRTADPRGGGQ